MFFRTSSIHFSGSMLSSYGTRRAMKRLASVPNPLPAMFLRGGTSKGIYIRKDYLPSNRAEWGHIFLGIMGSPDPEHGRQLNGMGGGVSSLSKICVVGRPDDDAAVDPDIDVEYTFCQVGIRDAALDYSGNCGNLSSMIGVFAVDEGLCQPRIVEGRPGVGAIRTFNTNTGKRVDTTFPVFVEDGIMATPVLDLPQVSIAGVPGLASRIDLHFVSPAGARTGKLLPTGRAIDILTFNHAGKSASINASLVDATNPSVFILSEDLARILGRQSYGELSYSARDAEECIEAIRRSGARAMGLDPEAKAQPKIAVVDSSVTPQSHAEAAAQLEHPSLVTHAFSMGVLHRAIPMTLGLCLGVAARIEGTLPWQVVSNAGISARHRSQSYHEKEKAVEGPKTDQGETDTVDLIRIRHPSGDVDVGAEFGRDDSLLSAKVVRTGRRLMKGVVWW